MILYSVNMIKKKESLSLSQKNKNRTKKWDALNLKRMLIAKEIQEKYKKIIKGPIDISDICNL